MASAWERAIGMGGGSAIGGGSLGQLTRGASYNQYAGNIRSGVIAPPKPVKAPSGGGTPPAGSVGSSVVDAASAGGNGGVVTQTKFNYPASLPAIPPDVQAAFLQQRRVAQRGVEDAEAYRQAGTQLAEARKLSAEQELTRQTGRDVNQTMSNYAAAGRAFSPMGVFQQRAEIAGGASRQQILFEEELAQTVQELNRLVADAERAREETNAGIEMQRAIMRSQAALEELRGREAIDRMNQQMGFV